MSVQKKKIKIQAVRNPVNPQETIHFLEKGILQIYLKNASLISFEELYRSAYNMVLYKHGDFLYKRVKNTVNDQIQLLRNSKIVPLLPQSMASVSQRSIEMEFLKKLKESWEEHELCLQMIRDVLMYMDRTYVKSANVPDIYSMGQIIFRDLILLQDQIKKSLVECVLHQIELERLGDVIDIFLIKRITDMLQDYTLQSENAYKVLFEPEFLIHSTQFYKMESLQLLEKVSVSEYLKYTQQRLSQEESRIIKYLDSETLDKIILVVEQEMLSNHAYTLLEADTGLIHMIYNREYADLSLLYKLLSRIPNGIDLLKTQLGLYMSKRVLNIHQTGTDASLCRSNSGLSSVSSSSIKVDHLVWMESMLKLKDEFDYILEECFGKDSLIEIHLNNALGVSLNENSQSAELTSLYVDDNLKKGIKGKSEGEIEILLDKTISLFRFLNEKDVFDRYYKQHLAKRLLLGKSISEDAERCMISKLKMECGYQFTLKLEGMFTDIHMSEETSVEFCRHLSCSSNSYSSSNSNTTSNTTPNLKIHILTSTYWPIHDSSNSIQLPIEIENLKTRFENFYHSRHSGRRLSWIWNMGTADLKVQFDKSAKEMTLSTFGMIVLLVMFQKSGDLPVKFTDILADTGIPIADLKRVLQSLSLLKYKILIKSSKGKEIHQDDTFVFNSQFTCPLVKIKIPLISSSNHTENEEERIKTMEKVDEDRKHQIEAAIVRIMKSRKTMHHSILVSEVIEQLKSRFSPSPSMIKKRIESLIEREYMERDADDIKKYIYTA